jgi:competence protein ComEA
MKRLVLLLAMLLFSAFALAAVNINTATKEELDALPGIGPVKAQAIIDYRSKNGPFKTPEDIMKVPGIKEGEFGKLKGQISVSGASTPVAAPATKEMKAAPATKDTKAAPTLAPDAVVPPGSAPAKAQEAKTAAPAMAPVPASGTAGAKKDEKAMKADEKMAKKDDKAMKVEEKMAKDDKAMAKGGTAAPKEDKAMKAADEKKAKADEAAAKTNAKDDEAAAKKKAKDDKAAADKAAKAADKAKKLSPPRTQH